MNRVLEREWLDDLPAEQPAALKSRRDLRRLNSIMAHDRIMAAHLARRGPGRRLLDLGCGDGTFAVRVAQRLPWRGVELELMDKQPLLAEGTRAAFAAIGWHAEPRTCDIFTGLKAVPSADIAMANLFLHHFDDAELTEMFALIAGRTDMFVACEPLRSPLPMLASRCLGALGCNAVTRHDAVASVRAGFCGSELTSLWPAMDDWNLRECRAGLFTHLLVATRK